MAGSEALDRLASLVTALAAAEARVVLIQALADEKCRCFLVRAEAAEAERDRLKAEVDRLSA